MNLEHVRALCWLRWRLTINQWRRTGALGAILAGIVTVLGVSIAITGAGFGLITGALLVRDLGPSALRGVWTGWILAFLLLWVIGLIIDLQKSEPLDLTRMLHLPVSLREVFILNYVATHLNFRIITMVPLAMGLAFGLAISRGPLHLLLIPAVLAMVSIVTAWTYSLQGWLGSLVSNPRKRRTVVMALIAIFVIAAQLPNIAMQVWLRKGGNKARPPGRARMTAVSDAVHRYMPFLWLSQSAKALAEGRPLPALAFTAGMAAIGALGLGQAYRSTLRFHTGANRRRLPARAEAAGAPATSAVGADSASRGRRSLLERTLPALSEEASTVALTSLRSMSRAPEVKMALGIGILVPAFAGFGFLMQGASSMPAALRALLAPILVTITALALAQLLANQFGFDRDGFRCLVLLPASGSDIVLGRNLALMPVAAIACGLLTMMSALAIRPGPLWILEAGLLFVSGFFISATFGTLASILFPYRIEPGSMKPTRASLNTHLGILAGALCLPAALIVIFLPGLVGIIAGRLGFADPAIVSLAAALLLALLVLEGYRRSLPAIGRLFEARMQRMLQEVTRTAE